MVPEIFVFVQFVCFDCIKFESWHTVSSRTNNFESCRIKVSGRGVALNITPRGWNFSEVMSTKRLWLDDITLASQSANVSKMPLCRLLYRSIEQQANCSWRGHVCLSEVYHCCTVDRTSQMFSSILPDLQQLAAVVALLFVQSWAPVPA